LTEQEIPSLLAQGQVKALAKLLPKDLEGFEFVATKMIKENSEWMRTRYGEEAASAYLDEAIRGVIETVETLIKTGPPSAPWLEQTAELFRQKLTRGIDYTDEFIRCGMRRD